MTKHTPGPWHWQIHDGSMASLGVGDNMGLGDPLVLSVGPCSGCQKRMKPETKWQWGRCQTPTEADARLIEAAPDLLEALQDAQALVAGWAATYQFDHKLKAPHETHQAIIDKVAAAIAKATATAA